MMPFPIGSSTKGRMPEDHSRRHYATVSVVVDGGKFIILLDNQPLYTLGGVLLTVPNCSLADAIAAEWLEQGDRIHLDTIPLTQLASTAIDCIDRIPTLHQRLLDVLLALVATDLVCYRVLTPTTLAEHQQIQWQPLLDWVAQYYGARLVSTTGVMPVPQSPAALTILNTALTKMDSLRLVALHRVSTLCSSLVIALALIDGEIDAEAAFTAAQIDVLFQARYWGEAATATTVRHDPLYTELHALAYFASLLKPVPLINSAYTT